MSKKPSKKPKKDAKPRKTYQFRIYPTHKQGRRRERWLGLGCEVYNAALDERKSAYRMASVVLSYEAQCAELLGCKEVRPDLCEVPSQVLQDVLKRVDLAFEAFYRRVAEGQTPGYPRFKSPFRYDSLTFKQYGNSFNLLPGSKKNTGTLVLAKLGQVKMVLHRPIKGTPKRRCSLAPSASSPRPPKGASSERRSARSWPACMSGSGIDGKTLLSKRFANSSNSSGCSRWRRWSCGIWFATRNWPRAVRMSRGRGFLHGWPP